MRQTGNTFDVLHIWDKPGRLCARNKIISNPASSLQCILTDMMKNLKVQPLSWVYQYPVFKSNYLYGSLFYASIFYLGRWLRIIKLVYVLILSIFEVCNKYLASWSSVSINKLYIVNKLYSNQMQKFRVSVQYYRYVGDLLKHLSHTSYIHYSWKVWV